MGVEYFENSIHSGSRKQKEIRVLLPCKQEVVHYKAKRFLRKRI